MGRVAIALVYFLVIYGDKDASLCGLSCSFKSEMVHEECLAAAGGVLWL